jgi:hypothetical protein
MMGKKMIVKRTLLLLSVMAATLIVASGMALAVNKVCPSGSTEQNPCLGTKKTEKASGKDLLIGTDGADYIKALSGNDNISAGSGNDTTDGGSGNDTYSYENGWEDDTLIDASGTDHLNFSALANGVYAVLVPETASGGIVQGGPNGDDTINFSSGTVVEKVTGSSSKDDYILTGGAANTLRPGSGTGGAYLEDVGGNNNFSSGVSIPASSDTYSGFAASGYGNVSIVDHGGTADKLLLPFASTGAYFKAINGDGDAAVDDLLIMTSNTDYVYLNGQLEPDGNQDGHIEQIQFTDGTVSIGGQAQAQSLSGAKTTGSAEAQVQKLNEASTLDAAERVKRSQVAKKIIEEAKKKAQDHDEKLSASGGEKR